MVANVAPMPRPMTVMAGASDTAVGVEPATSNSSQPTPATVTTMPARVSLRPSLVSRFMLATEAITRPAATGAKPTTAARSGL